MRRTLLLFLSILLAALGGMAALQPAHAVTLTGQRIKVTGIWKEGKLFTYKLKYRDSRRNPNTGRIAGAIADVDKKKKTFRIGPITIAWNDDTRFDGLAAADLADGMAVRAIGKHTGSGRMTATILEPGPSDLEADTLQVLGTISVVRREADGSALVTVLDIPMVIPVELTSPAFLLTRKQDDRRPDDQLTVELFDRPLSIGGEIGMTPRYRRDFDLNPDRNRDRVRLDLETQLELFYPWSANLAVFLELKAAYEQELYRGGRRKLRSQEEIKRGETWLFWGDIAQSGISFELGRQNFREPREWWWDNDLDALRIYYTRPFLHFEAGVSQQLFPVSTADNGIPAEEQGVLRILARGAWQWASKQELGLFFLHQQDFSRRERVNDFVLDEFLDPVDGDFTWVGLRTLNKWSTDDYGEFDLWGDGAWIGGDERSLVFVDTDVDGLSRVLSVNGGQINGWALDVGLTWEAPLSWRPALTFGYAIGTTNFRQTGLQDNNDRFRNISRFRYYGELLRPELSNLRIWTAAATVPFLSNSSATALYHYYRQVTPQPFLRQGRISADPNGISPSIGREWDLIVSLEEWKHWELEFIAALFEADTAYGDLSGNTAFDLVLKVNYNF